MKKGPVGAQTFRISIEELNEAVLSLQSFGPLLHLEFHRRTFIQSAIAVGLDGRKVHENIVAARPLDESIALAALNHFTVLFSSLTNSPDDGRSCSWIFQRELRGVLKNFRGACEQPIYS